MRKSEWSDHEPHDIDLLLTQVLTTVLDGSGCQRSNGGTEQDLRTHQDRSGHPDPATDQKVERPGSSNRGTCPAGIGLQVISSHFVIVADDIAGYIHIGGGLDHWQV
jgi:hypothetical protein